MPRGAGAARGTVGQRAGAGGMPCRGVGDRAGALVHLPAFERKFMARRSQTAPPAALAFTHSHNYKTRTVSCPIPSIMVTEQLLFTYVVHEKPFILHSWLCRPREECTRSTWRPIH